MVGKRLGTTSPSDSWSRPGGFGLLRLLLALAVIASHAKPLGFGRPDLGLAATHGQADLGTLAVCGFFALSGLLITGSAGRLGVGRFLWHRALRILPGLWCCLLLTALVLAPLLAVHEGQPLSPFWVRPDGPWGYLAADWAVTMHQYGIGGLLAHTPYPTAFDGSLWSLRYELLAYLVVALLAVTRVLRRARWVVVAAAAGPVIVLARQAAGYDWLRAPTYTPHGTIFTLPVFGHGNTAQLVPLFLMFALGALAELYREQLPAGPLAAALALLLFLGSLRLGGFTLLGLPAFAYLLLRSGLRMPAALRRVGARHDYSYGLYIYAFPVQQTLAEFGAGRWGYLPYTALSVLGAAVPAVLSWHLVEAPALRLKSAFRRPVRAPGPIPPQARARRSRDGARPGG